MAKIGRTKVLIRSECYRRAVQLARRLLQKYGEVIFTEGVERKVLVWDGYFRDKVDLQYFLRDSRPSDVICRGDRLVFGEVIEKDCKRESARQIQTVSQMSKKVYRPYRDFARLFWEYLEAPSRVSIHDPKIAIWLYAGGWPERDETNGVGIIFVCRELAEAGKLVRFEGDDIVFRFPAEWEREIYMKLGLIEEASVVTPVVEVALTHVVEETVDVVLQSTSENSDEVIEIIRGPEYAAARRMFYNGINFRRGFEFYLRTKGEDFASPQANRVVKRCSFYTKPADWNNLASLMTKACVFIKVPTFEYNHRLYFWAEVPLEYSRALEEVANGADIMETVAKWCDW